MTSKQIIAVVGATGAQGGGLVRAILADPDSRFRVRAITRNTTGEIAQELARLGADVVGADLDDAESLRRAFAGVHGVYAVTNFWEHFSPAREIAQAQNLALAARDTGAKHLIWSTLEDTRKWVPLDHDRMPTLHGTYKVPHFDAKSEADRLFVNAGVPTTFLLASFYWENMIHFGMGPRRGTDGSLAITFPLGDKKMAGIAAEDIGRCAYGIFNAGPERYAGRFVGIAGDHTSGAEMASALSKALGQEVRYNDVSPETYRGFGFPGADDLGNMFQFYRDFEQTFLASRDLEVSRGLNSSLQSFETWLSRNASRLPIE